MIETTIAKTIWRRRRRVIGGRDAAALFAGTRSLSRKLLLWSSVCLVFVHSTSLSPGRDPAVTLKFEKLGREENEGAFDPHFAAVRRGRRMDSMLLVAPVAIGASLAGLSGDFTFECLAAPVYNIGDGMRMELVLAAAGSERTLYSRYFDAGRRAGDRDWIPLAAPVNLRDSGEPELLIRLSGGRQGDLVADWLALASARLVQRARQ